MNVIINDSATSTQLAKEIIEQLGRRKAMWLRTRLSQLVEAEDGRRQGARGRDRVPPRAWVPTVVNIRDHAA